MSRILHMLPVALALPSYMLSDHSPHASFVAANSTLKFSQDAKSTLNFAQDDEKMLARIAKVQAACGELCKDEQKRTPGRLLDTIRNHVNCDTLFDTAEIDAVREQAEAPKELPAKYMADFTMNGRFLSENRGYYDQKYLGGEASTPQWTAQQIDGISEQAKSGSFDGIGPYGPEQAKMVWDALAKSQLEGKRVMVIGSETPWVEALCLAHGASHVVTLEYGSIKSEHPKVSTMTPNSFRAAYKDNSLEKVDSIVSYSSLEHAGLGRYGDALLPWGDIIAVARAWCVTKPGGSMTLGLPYEGYDNGAGDAPKEGISFNLHRQYGPIRLPHVASNWECTDAVAGPQKVHIFKKLDPLP